MTVLTVARQFALFFLHLSVCVCMCACVFNFLVFPHPAAMVEMGWDTCPLVVYEGRYTVCSSGQVVC